jgi:hypothetical protein
MTRFAPGVKYRANLDVRFVHGRPPRWAEPLVEAQPPNARCWLVVLPRRGGKSWLASAIVNARAKGSTRRVDLRGADAAQAKKAGLHRLHGGKTSPPPWPGVLLIDEPGLATANGPGVPAATLAAVLELLQDAGTVTVVLATPHEYALLLPHLGPDGPKDVLFPPPLCEQEIARMADRVPDWGPEVVERVRTVDPSWLRSPFLLELLLHVAEEERELRTDAAALVRAAVDEAESRHDYLTQVFYNGLSREQRRELRANRWQTAGIEIPPTAPASLLSRTPVPQDPMVAHHLPEVLRIHHISDLHHGGTLRSTVDAKDRSQAGRKIAELAGAGTPLDSYLSHVTQLADQGQAPHLVIVTGDVVNRPNPAFGEQAVAWLHRLRVLLADHHDLRPEARASCWSAVTTTCPGNCAWRPTGWPGTAGSPRCSATSPIPTCTCRRARTAGCSSSTLTPGCAWRCSDQLSPAARPPATPTASVWRPSRARSSRPRTRTPSAQPSMASNGSTRACSRAPCWTG